MSSKRSLPDALKKLESHLTWMEADWLTAEIPGANLAGLDTLKDYVKSLLDNPSNEIQQDDDILEGADEDELKGEQSYVNFKGLAQRLNIAAMRAYIGDFEVATKWLNRAREDVQWFVDLKMSQGKALFYCIEALEWSIKQLESILTSGKKSGILEEEEDLEQEMKKLKLKWEDLQDANDGECDAVLQYFKGSLGAVLMIPLDKVLEMYETVADLDPNYYEWYQAVYRLLRRIRRSVKRNKNEILESPCEKESLACRSAYSLGLDKFQCVSDMGLLIKEELWTANAAVWDEKEEDYLFCVQLFRNAIEVAALNKLERYVWKSKIYLGEVLLFGRGSKLAELQEEGKALFEECERLYPNCSMVLHKIARLYQHGSSGTRNFRNSGLAKKYYIRALEAGRQNFACLMDYTKFIKMEATKNNPSPNHQERCFKDLLRQYDETLKVLKRDHQLAKLLMLKGCVIWCFNPYKGSDNEFEAAKIWLKVLKNHPDYAANLYETIKNPPFLSAWKQPAKIEIARLIEILDQLKVDNEAVCDDVADAVSTFIDGLKCT